MRRIRSWFSVRRLVLGAIAVVVIAGIVVALRPDTGAATT